jgi:hypothetical protein
MRTHRITPYQSPAKFDGWTLVRDNDTDGLTGTEAEEAASALIFALGDGGDGRLDPTFNREIGPALDVVAMRLAGAARAGQTQLKVRLWQVAGVS